MNTPASLDPCQTNEIILKRTLVAFFFLLSACTGSDPQPDAVPGNIYTIAGIAGEFDHNGDGGPAIKANLGYGTGIAVDGAGDIYFADGAANVIRKTDVSTEIISTIAGTFLGFNAVDPTPYLGDGGLATSAHLNVPLGVAVDGSGNVYIADAGNSIIRKVTSSTGVIATIAGRAHGSLGYSGNGGLASAAEFYTPYDVAVDQSGNVYIADSQNHSIRKIAATTGIITTVAGTGPASAGFTGDGGPATSAKLNSPQGVTVDAFENVFIVDAGNHAIRRVSASTGIITTITGTGAYGYQGDGGPASLATLHAPSQVAIAESGDVYIADQGNHVICKIDATTGIITTLAGTGNAGYSGDGGPATSAQLSSPQGVALDLSGSFLVLDRGNSIIRAVVQ